MNPKDEKKFYTKIYILIILTMLVIAGLLFFILSGSADTIRTAVNRPEQQGCVPQQCEPGNQDHPSDGNKPDDSNSGDKDPKHPDDPDSGNTDPSPDDSGQNTPDDPDSGNTDPSPDDSGENTPDDPDSGNTDPSPDDSGQNTPNDPNSGNTDPSPDDSGQNTPDDPNSGNTDPSPDDSGENTPDDPNSGNTDPSPEGQIPDTAANDSVLKIVNPFRLIDPSYVPADLRTVNVNSYGTQRMRNDAAGAMEEMFAAAANDGIDLYLVSGYRSYERQIELWNWWKDNYGEAHARRIDDWPGGSEHQIGLSADIGTDDHYCELNTCFGDTAAFAWLQAHSWEYGYVERYPAGKEPVTGIMYSPWNYRYIGREEAQKVYSSGLSMEEYYGLAG